MSPQKRSILLGLALAASGLLVVAYLAANSASRDDVPARFTTAGLIMVPVRVGGAEGWYLLDTGAATTVIASSAAYNLKLSGHSADVSSSVSPNQAVEAGQVLTGGIEFAHAALRYPEHVIVMDLSPAETRLEHELQGIVGWDVLRNFVVGIDGRGRRLLASRKVEASAMFKRLGVKGAVTQLALETMNDLPFIRATSDASELKLVLDTGATMTVLFSETWRRLGDDPFTEMDAEKSRWTITGETPFQTGRLNKLTLGPLHLIDLPVAITSVQAASARKGASMVPYDGILGMDVLSRGVVVIDGPAATFFIKE